MDSSLSTDFVIIGLQPWDIEIGSNCKNIALELSKSHRVLYVNRALDRFSWIRHFRDRKVKNRLQVIRGKKDALELVSENLWVYSPPIVLESIGWIGSRRLFDFMSRVNGNRLASVVSNTMKRLSFNNVTILIDNDFLRGRYFKDYITKVKTVYYIRDYLTEQSYFKKHGARYEQKIIQEVDVVLANSSYLASYASRYNKKSFDVGQGCDLSDFIERKRLIPKNLENIKRPIIGYVGALLSSRLDISVIRYIAERNSDWSIVLVGPEDEGFQKSDLHSLPNIHFLGIAPKEQVPDYIANFDVCINPQAINPSTIGNYPRKIDEYLATGKPVVATATETMNMFKEYVYLGKSAEDYIANIKKALQEKENDRQVEKRIKLAFSHTWQDSVEKMKKYMFSDFNKMIEV